MKLKNLPFRLLCDITSNFKDLTKFGSDSRSLTFHTLNCFFFKISLRLSGPFMPVQIDTFLWKKQVIPQFFRRVYKSHWLLQNRVFLTSLMLFNVL